MTVAQQKFSAISRLISIVYELENVPIHIKFLIPCLVKTSQAVKSLWKYENNFVYGQNYLN